MSTFVLDTSVLLSDFNALDAFPNAEIVLPLTVLRELDGKKKGQDEVARSAREVNRILAGYAKSGELSEGVKLENGSILRVIPDQCVENGMTSLSKDDQIINTAVWLKEAEGKDVTLVSQDFNMQVIGNVAGLKVDKFVGLDSTNIKDEIYTGHAEIQTSSEMIGRFKEERGLNITEFPEHKLLCNQFVTFKCGKQSMMGWVNADNRIMPFKGIKEVHDVEARNREQKLAFQLLLDKNIHLVTLLGIAGTGKTLCILAAALKQVEEGVYDRIIITKPMVAVGKDIGFFPGNKQEKLNPWMGSIFDNLRLLIGDHELEKMMAEEKIEFESLSLFRGRSMPNAIILIDEAQNLNRKEVKTIVTRAGENSKVIMTADINQIDNPYVDSITNGATYVIEKLKGQPIIGHITLTKGERSPLATLAAELL